MNDNISKYTLSPAQLNILAYVYYRDYVQASQKRNVGIAHLIASIADIEKIKKIHMFTIDPHSPDFLTLDGKIYFIGIMTPIVRAKSIKLSVIMKNDFVDCALSYSLDCFIIDFLTLGLTQDLDKTATFRKRTTRQIIQSIHLMEIEHDEKIYLPNAEKDTLLSDEGTKIFNQILVKIFSSANVILYM
jgi:hypothetical protein